MVPLNPTTCIRSVRACLIISEESTDVRIPYYPFNNDSLLRIYIAEDFSLISLRMAEKVGFDAQNP